MSGSDFEAESVSGAFERAVRGCSHLGAADAAAVAAARALARKIDAWDVIVDWALEDAAERDGARPAVPQNDNVSIATFLKYLVALQLVPQESAGPSSESQPKDELEAFKQARGIGAAG